LESFGGSGVVAPAFGDVQTTGIFDYRDDGSDGDQVCARGRYGWWPNLHEMSRPVVVRLYGWTSGRGPGGPDPGRWISAGQAGDGVGGLADGLAGFCQRPSFCPRWWPGKSPHPSG
jgi:hypothetical protein